MTQSSSAPTGHRAASAGQPLKLVPCRMHRPVCGNVLFDRTTFFRRYHVLQGRCGGPARHRHADATLGRRGPGAAARNQQTRAGHKIYSYLLRTLAICEIEPGLCAGHDLHRDGARLRLPHRGGGRGQPSGSGAQGGPSRWTACHAKEVIEQAFGRRGLHEIVNTDQGSQLAMTMLARLNRLKSCA